VAWTLCNVAPGPTLLALVFQPVQSDLATIGFQGHPTPKRRHRTARHLLLIPVRIIASVQ
jgi:hypothetical protein